MTDQQKDKEKALAAEVKREEKLRKEEEKAAKAEQKRLAKKAKEEKQVGKGKELATVSDLDQSSPDEKPTALQLSTRTRAESSGLTRLSMPFQRRVSPPQRASTTPDGGASPILEPQSATASPTSKVKAWLKNRFSRPRATSGASIASSRVDTTADGAGDASSSPDMNRGFIGGVALTRKLEENNTSVPSVVGDDNSVPGSIREVALAGLSAPTPVQSATMTPAINLPQDEPGEASGTNTVPDNNSTNALGTAALKSSSRPISAIGGFDAVPLAAITTTTTTTNTTTEPTVRRDRPPSPSTQAQNSQLILPYVTPTVPGETNSVSSLSSSDLSGSIYSSVSHEDRENDADEFLEARSTFSSHGPVTPPSANFPAMVNVAITQPTPGFNSEEKGQQQKRTQFLMAADPRFSTGSGFGGERPVSSGGLSVGSQSMSISGCGRISPFRESRFSENFDKED